MTRRVIGQGMVTAGLGVLLLAGGGVWDEAEADRGRRGGRHHHQHHHHHGFHGKHFHGPRFHVGPRFYPYYFGAYHYGGYYNGYVPPVVVTPPPAVFAPPSTSYVERAPVSQYWHYCQDPAGYYPEVQQCPGGWTQVPPRSE